MLESKHCVWLKLRSAADCTSGHHIAALALCMPLLTVGRDVAVMHDATSDSW